MCRTDLPHRELVVRSLLTLRLLTHEDTGGIVAAPTTSLPEDFGGERNWDYRYCWLRDAALTLEALLTPATPTRPELWRDWLLRAVAGDPEDLQIMYAVDGARQLPERELDHLPGYAGSRPVRIGNGAVDQRQTDVLGEVMIALEHAREAGLGRDGPELGAAARPGRRPRPTTGRSPDNGLWEIRGEPAAFHPLAGDGVGRVRPGDQGGRGARLDGPVDRWRQAP